MILLAFAKTPPETPCLPATFSQVVCNEIATEVGKGHLHGCRFFRFRLREQGDQIRHVKPSRRQRPSPGTSSRWSRIRIIAAGSIRRSAYLSAVEDASGADIDYATLTKLYGGDGNDERRYSPAPASAVSRRTEVIGWSDDGSGQMESGDRAGGGVLGAGYCEVLGRVLVYTSARAALAQSTPATKSDSANTRTCSSAINKEAAARPAISVPVTM